MKICYSRICDSSNNEFPLISDSKIICFFWFLILLKAYAFLFRLVLVSNAKGDPPLYWTLIESDSSLSWVTPAAPILSFPKALSCVFLSVTFSFGLPKGSFSSYPSGTSPLSYLCLPYKEAKSCGVP